MQRKNTIPRNKQSQIAKEAEGYKKIEGRTLVVCVRVKGETQKELRALVHRLMPKARNISMASLHIFFASSSLPKDKNTQSEGSNLAHTIAKLPERIAAIVSQTHAEIGENATIADDEALMKIRDALHDAGIKIEEHLADKQKEGGA